MWIIAGLLFGLCKIVALANGPRGGGWRRLAFLVAWPGMDVRKFLHGTVRRPHSAEWLSAFAKTALGAILYFGLARYMPHPLAVGWMGMVGIIFLLHCGSFHVLSAAWRTMGVDAEPIMRWPIAAESLGEFWGRRWNLAFNELAERFVFRPCTRRFGLGVASLAAFFASGLIHELAISVPAWGGWGLPTAYFVAQGIGTLVERSRIGKRLGLRRGWRGRLFTLAVVAGPAFFLFHPPFVFHVILPMMRATGAL
jgi:alginate O-acetyltransferase complex protein AlgI